MVGTLKTQSAVLLVLTAAVDCAAGKKEVEFPSCCPNPPKRDLVESVRFGPLLGFPSRICAPSHGYRAWICAQLGNLSKSSSLSENQKKPCFLQRRGLP